MNDSTIYPAIATIIAALIALYGIWYGKKKEKDLEETRMRQVSDPAKQFLSIGETLTTYDADSTDFRNRLSSVHNNVKMITLTGAAWMLNPKVKDSIKKAMERGVDVSLLLQDPYCEEAKEERNLEFSISAVPDIGAPKRPSEYLAENVKRTITEYLPILGKDRIRILDDIIVMKGTIFDSKIAQIISYAIPKRGAPMRIIVNPSTVSYIEKHYFDRKFSQAIPVDQKLREWRKISNEDWKDLKIP